MDSASSERHACIVLTCAGEVQSLTPRRVQVASLAAQLAQKTEALESSADEVAVLRSKCKDAELQLTRLAAEARAAQASEKGPRHPCSGTPLNCCVPMSQQWTGSVLGRSRKTLKCVCAPLPGLSGKPTLRAMCRVEPNLGQVS